MMSNLRPGIHVSFIPHRYFQLATKFLRAIAAPPEWALGPFKVQSRKRSSVHCAQLGPAICGWPRPSVNLFFVQGTDKSALVDPSDERWIDNEIRIGLCCLRVMSGNH